MTPSRILIFSAVALLTTTWVYAATLELRGEKLAQRIAANKVDPESFTPVPLTAEPTRLAARRLLAERSTDHDRIEDLLAYSVRQRPLYAPYWLDRAEAAHRAGDDERAEKYLEITSSLWSNRPILLWKTAMLRTRMGHTEKALVALRDYLSAQPTGHDRALAVALRLQPDPRELLPAVLPDRLNGDRSRDDIAWRILQGARSRDQVELGRAAWHELSPVARRHPETVRYYVEWMAALGNRTDAMAAWAAYRLNPAMPTLENGGFERRLAGGLEWRVWDRDGIALSRDATRAYRGRYSLKVAFAGTENLHFAHLRQYLPVAPATAYTLSFAWRGKNVSTRSGPFVELHGPNTGTIAHTEDRWGTWDWERRELSFTAPENEQFVEVRLRRNRTSALDNEIGGTLWLDDFKLTADRMEARSG